MKYGYIIMGLLFIGGLTLGLLIAFSVTRCARSALASPRVSIATINDKPALVVSVDEHPLWAHTNVYGVDFKYSDRIIDVAEFYVPWHPFSHRVLGRSPIVIQQGLLTGSYALRFWDGQEYVEAGHIIVGDNGSIEWIAKDKAKER